MLKAPFPYFGGKSRVSAVTWHRFGSDVCNYVEPFFGSGAVLLGRPDGAGRNETVNDLDCWIANFFRAVAVNPEAVAEWADDPVNEVDLHARHLWLVQQAEFREKIKADPEYYDAKIAGWWVWGISQWIGSGWCVHPDWSGRTNAGRAPRGIHAEQWRKRPGIHRGGRGVHSNLATAMPQQRPDLSGDSGASGRGVHAKYVRGDIYSYFNALSARLRRVRVCCGDWSRILGPSVTTKIGVTAVFLDPPYAVERNAVYAQDSTSVAHDVRKWAIENGDNPAMRIALCGYEGEHDMPESWSVLAWKANGGYANQSDSTRGRDNATKERIWFSPHCLQVEKTTQSPLEFPLQIEK